MNNYINVTFTITPAEESIADVLAALLADVGFESFVPEETGLTAYAPKALFDSDAVADEIAQNLEALVGTTNDVAPKAEPRHPNSDTTNKFSSLNLQFGRNYDVKRK